MKSHRNQLILLGIICQGFTWDDWFLPMVGVVFWYCGIMAGKRGLSVPPMLDAIALIGGTALAFILGNAFERNTHFFIGHGLSLLQCVRLTRKLTYKEQCVSVVIALFHLGVVCTFLFDIRFIPVLITSIYLIPKVLHEVSSMEYAGLNESANGSTILIKPSTEYNPVTSNGGKWIDTRLPGVYGIIIIVMLLFFLVFPRGNLSSAIGPRRAGTGDTGAFFGSIMDPTKGGREQSSRVFMHVEGEKLNYFRIASLTDFDGVKWYKNPRSGSKRVEYLPPEALTNYFHRRITVKNTLFLEKNLPCDGPVANLGGNFFARPTVNLYGDLFTQIMWNTSNNKYEYWTPKEKKPEPLYSGFVYRHTNHPPQSARLHALVDRVVSTSSDRFRQAKALELYLKTNLTYEIGGAELNSSNPVDDFVFNKKRGHCERFSSALTLMLRMCGIPSRVVVGYVPTTRNILSGGFNIRYNDAHAWTEAYIPNQGWVLMDATPSSAFSRGSRWRTLLDDLDLAWAMYVVNYDAPAQNKVFSSIMSAVGLAALYLEKASFWLLTLLVGLLVFLLLRPLRLKRSATLKKQLTPTETIALANHYYGDMLALLSSVGMNRNVSETPLEFLNASAPRLNAIQNSVAFITQMFCRVRYGTYKIDLSEHDRLANELQLIRRWVQSEGQTGYGKMPKPARNMLTRSL